MSTPKAPRAYTSCITSDEIYVDEPYLSIRWDSVNNFVHAEWKAFANSAEFRAGLSKGIQAIQDHRAAAYVTDLGKLNVEDVAALCADHGHQSLTFPSMEEATRFASEVPISS
jgi:hypothetical protein